MKQFFKLTGLVIFLFQIVNQSTAQELTNKAQGNWSGQLELPTSKLEIIFKISADENGKLSSKMDVPLQGAKDLPVSKTEVRNDSLFLEVAMIMGSFKGIFETDKKITGVWKQGGVELALVLEKTDKVTELNRPQTPQKPFPYLEKEVEYLNQKSGFKLAGTLTIPKDAKECPAVILITGSGAQDRDETIFEHKPFMVIADYLTKNGIAVLRVDDRGVGGSEGNISESTSEDFAGDVLAGIDFLKTIDIINHKKIGLIGHSEGGLIAPIVASNSDDVAFIVMLAGPGIVGEQIIYEQIKLISIEAGLTNEQIEQNLTLQKAIFNILINEKDTVKQLDRLQRSLSGGMYPMLDDEKKKLIDAQIEGLSTKWYKYFLTYKPYPTLTKVTCPVLALNGEKDLQVPPKLNLEAIKNALTKGGNNNFETIELENLNHLFQNCETGAVAEYAQIEETISLEVLQIIKDWILEVVI